MALDHPYPFTSYDLSRLVVSSCWGCLTAFYVLNAATSQVEITWRCKGTLRPYGTDLLFYCYTCGNGGFPGFRCVWGPGSCDHPASALPTFSSFAAFIGDMKQPGLICCAAPSSARGDLRGGPMQHRPCHMASYLLTSH